MPGRQCFPVLNIGWLQEEIMAETKKRRTSGGGKSSAKRKSSARKPDSGRKGSRRNDSGPDLLTIIVVIVAVILVTILILNFNKEKKGKDTPDLSPTVSLTPGLTETPEPTKMPTATPVPEPTKEPEVTEPPKEDLFLPRGEAEELIRKNLDTSVYKVELLNDELPIDGKHYYLFCIDDMEGNTYEPLVIVEKLSGELYYYDPLTGTVSEFSGFPLDATEKQETGDTTITKERAVELVKGFSAAQLGLEKEPEHYQLEVDDWSSVVMAKECYGINVFEVTGGRTRLRGVFYVSYDGKSVYRQDSETNEFIEIRK